MRKQRAEARRVVLDIAAVGIPHHLQRIVGRRHSPRLMDRAQRRHHGRFDRQRMGFDVIGAAERLDAFVLAAKIERALHAELGRRRTRGQYP